MNKRIPLFVVGLSALGLLVASLSGGGRAGSGESTTPSTIATKPAGTVSRTTTPRAAAPSAPLVIATKHFDRAPGDRFLYVLDARWSARLDPASGSHDDEAGDLEWNIGEGLPSSVATRLHANLEVTIVSASDEEYLLRVAMHDAVASVSTGADTENFDPSALEAPVLVRLSADGRALGYSFEPGVPGHVQGLLIGAFSASHQFIPRDQTSPWTVGGLRDETGSYTAEFSWDGPSTLRRSITGYDDMAQEVEHSVARARVADGWIESAESRETRIAAVEGLFRARTSVGVDLKLVERTTVNPEAVATQRNRSWQTKPVSDPEPDQAFPESYEQDDRDRIEDPAAALEDAVAEIATITDTDALYGSAGFDAWQQLARLAREHPEEALPLMEDLVRSGELEASSQNWILSALGVAGGEGSAASTELLASLIVDAELPTDLRMSALIAAHQLDSNVTTEMIEIATDILLADGDPENPLPTTAAMLLGHFAAQTGLPRESRELLDAGLDLVRESSFGRDEPAVYFAALRNSGRPDLIEQSFEYIDHDDASVRSAAASSLGGLPSSTRARERLLDVASHDDSAEVRSAAVDALVEHEPSPEAAAALGDIAVADGDPEVRGRAVDTLHAQALRGSTAARIVLTELGTGESEAAESARSALSDLEESVDDDMAAGERADEA